MSKDDIQNRITQNAAAANLEVSVLRVVPDPYRGWRVYLVSPGFVDMPDSERKRIALSGLDDVPIQWTELLSPEEAEWSSEPPSDIELERMPMWPEALARGARHQPVLFASDLDNDVPLPIAATFYSMRGGVGRSTALAYAAVILAGRGHSVLCIDMDLEAPGLATLFGRESDITPDMGIVDLLLRLEQGEEPQVIDHVLRLSESDELYLIPAGVPSADYARKLRLLNPESWYREHLNPLHKLIDMCAELPFQPEIILIDARTGMTAISAPLLFDVSDVTVVTFFPHPQARLGTQALVKALLAAKSRRVIGEHQLTPEPRFLASPIPAVKGPASERYRVRAYDWITEWLNSAGDGREENLRSVEARDVTQFIMYQEAIATSDQLVRGEEIRNAFAGVADWIERFLPTRGELEVPPLAVAKRAVLGELQFSAGTAEYQDNFLAAFVETEVVEAALRTDKPLVLGRKGTGKTAVFRWIAEAPEYRSAVAMAPSAFRQRYPWVLGPDAFSVVDRVLRDNHVSWREFWTVYVALGVYLAGGESTASIAPTELAEPTAQLRSGASPEGRVVTFLQDVCSRPNVGSVGWSWLEALDESLPEDQFVLLDGLDTGFGNSDEERNRRARAIEGLLAMILDREAGLRHCWFKVLLREDIWRQLRFQNKSHLFGRSVRLEWRTPTDYFKPVLIQATTNSQTFWTLASDVVRGEGDVAKWAPDETLRVWNLLVGERMRGGRTIFTRNWVWNRLADGNGDHGPRALLQLFREAKDWETREDPSAPYDRSIIRPRALIESLDTVSLEAVEALREEFGELDGLIQRVQSLGRSPIDASDIADLKEQVRLAREVGLLEVYEGTEEQVVRYRIPDLYRVGLGVTRRGPG